MITTQELVISSTISISMMMLCYLVGVYNYSFLWILFAIIGHIYKGIITKKRQDKRNFMQFLHTEKEAVIAAMHIEPSQYPAWVNFPAIERCEFLNKMTKQLWPYLAEYSQTFLREIIEPQICSQLPNPFKSFKFLTMDCGDLPFRISGIKVYTKNVGRDKIIIDMDVSYAGDADFTVNFCGLTGGINEIIFSGKLRIVCQPLIPMPPIIAGASFSFIDTPELTFTLTGLGNLPGLYDVIKSIVMEQTRSMCVLPNKMFIPLIPDVDMTSLYFPEPDGVVLINLLSARNLENKDINLLQFKDKSDPYCKINLGKFMFRSKTVNNDLNPKFNEEYEAVVEDANIQTIRFELFDCDTTSSDEELGKLAIKLDGIKEAKSINKWYYLDACKHGEIHLGFEWILLKKEIEYLYKPLYLKDSKLYGKNVYNKEARCLLLIFVDSVNSLPCTKANVHPSPFITLELDKTIQKTPTKLNTICPIFQSKFSFFFAGPEDKTLKVVCKDDGSKKTLGELEIKINTLFTQPNMEFFQQIFYLTYGINQSSIILTAKLRVLEPAIMSKEKDGIDQFYGTGQHIERASKTDAFSPIIDMIPNNSTTTVLNQDTVEQITKGNGHIHVARPAVSVDTSHLHSPIKSMKSPGSVNSLMSESGSNVSRRKGILSKLTTKKHEMIKNALDFTLNNRELPQIEICLDYDKEKFLLQLEVISLKDLFPLEKNGHIQSYVNIKLFQIGKEGAVSKQSTHVVEDSCSPHFSAIFNFAIIPSHLPNYVLRFEVKDGINYGFKKPPVLAWGDYKLNDFNSDQKLVNYCMKLKQSADGR